MADRLGSRLRHIHLTDGTGSAKDEHLVPGRGSVGAADFLRHIARSGFQGEIVLEINTRKAATREEREKDLRESLEFAREHFSSQLGPSLRGGALRSARHERVSKGPRTRISELARIWVSSGRPSGVTTS